MQKNILTALMLILAFGSNIFSTAVPDEAPDKWLLPHFKIWVNDKIGIQFKSEGWFPNSTAASRYQSEVREVKTWEEMNIWWYKDDIKGGKLLSPGRSDKKIVMLEDVLKTYLFPADSGSKAASAASLDSIIKYLGKKRQLGINQKLQPQGNCFGVCEVWFILKAS